MKTEKTLTFEEVNAHVEKHLPGEKTQSLTATANDLCGIYVIVRPILVLISQFPLIPKKWRDIIIILIKALDGICPPAEGQ